MKKTDQDLYNLKDEPFAPLMMQQLRVGAAVSQSDFWQFRSGNDRIGFLNQLAAFRFVVVRTVVNLRVAMPSTVIVAAPGRERKENTGAYCISVKVPQLQTFQ